MWQAGTTLHHGARASHYRGLSLRSTGSRRAGSVIVAHGPSCSAARGIFPDQGSNPCPLHWQADSQPLRHQGSPPYTYKCSIYGPITPHTSILYSNSSQTLSSLSPLVTTKEPQRVPSFPQGFEESSSNPRFLI